MLNLGDIIGPRCALAPFVLLSVLAVTPLSSRADDGGGLYVLPWVPGTNPSPSLPDDHDVDQGTIPIGGTNWYSVTPADRAGQSFKPSLSTLDWTAFVFSHSNQGVGAVPYGPSDFRVGVYRNFNYTTGAATNLLGYSNVTTVQPGLRWELFSFDQDLALTPGVEYFMNIEWVGGYDGGPDGSTGLQVAGRYNPSTYVPGHGFAFWHSAYGYVGHPHNFAFDLTFATGTITNAPNPGDTDLNGVIDARDYLAIDRGRALRLSGWANGDFTGNGVIDADDYTILDRAFLSQRAAPTAPSAPVPEPTTLIVLAMTLAALLTRTRAAARRCLTILPLHPSLITRQGPTSNASLTTPASSHSALPPSPR